MGKTHKTLGKYEAVSVSPLLAEETETSIVGSINDYGWDFHPDTEIELPKKVIAFLRAQKVPRYKKNSKGVLIEYSKKRYAIEKVEQEEEATEKNTSPDEGLFA